MNLLEVENLHVHFIGSEGVVRAVNGVSFAVKEGKTVGVAGDNGCGKTVTASAILALIPKPGKIVAGSIRFQGRDLLTLSKKELKRIRGRGIFMIFQSPASVLNPSLKVETQIAELLVRGRGCSWSAARRQTPDFLERVGIAGAKARAYPFQLSGGMRQRALMAMALVLEPRLLIADEPTTGLDAINQEALIEAMAQLQKTCGTSLLVISHDLSILAALAQELIVFHQGTVIENGLTTQILREPRHPEVQRLVKATEERDARYHTTE